MQEGLYMEWKSKPFILFFSLYFLLFLDLLLNLKKRDYNYEIKFDIQDLWMNYFVVYEGNKDVIRNN